MTTRLYLTNSAATYAVGVIRGAFNTTAGLVGGLRLGKTKAGTNTAVSVAESSSANAYKVGLLGHISDPMSAGTIGGDAAHTLTYALARQESNAAANDFLFIHIWFTVGNTDTLRGTLLANWTGTSEYPTTLTASAAALTLTTASIPEVTPVTIQDGDRMVVEIGYSAANVSAVSYTGTLRVGGTAADLATSGTTGVTTNSPWLEFSTALDALFVEPVPAASLTGGGSLTGSAASGIAGGATLSGAGVLGANGARVLPLAADLSGGGSLTADGIRVKPGVAGLAGAGSLVAGTVLQQHASQGALTGRGALTGGPWQTHLVATALTGRGALTGGARQNFVVTTLLTGSGILLAGTRLVPAPDHSRSQLGLPARVTVQPTRVIAQNILSGQFLHWELPVSNLSVTFNLSGPTVISGDFPTELRDLRDLNLEPWGTWLHVEENGLIRASGILQPTAVDTDETLTVEAVGVSAYPKGIPYLGQFTLAGPTGAVGVGIDPADIVRNIWAELQSYPDGNLGVQVVGATPVRVGTPAEDVSITTGGGATSNFTAGPYSALDWWESKDCGSEIDTLAKATPFEFMERSQWNAGKTGVEHFIDIGYPRIGRRLTEVRFAQDENLLTAVGPEETDDLYASQVILLGSGEGSAKVRGYAGRPMGTRLRRVAMIDDKTISATARANALCSTELDRRSGAALRDVTECTVRARHPNAPLGSFTPGDEVLLTARVPWAGEVRQYQRITSFTYSPQSEAIRVAMRNAASWSYGGSS